MEAKTQRSELTQQAIVDAALEMACETGLDSLSIGELAKRLNLSKSGVFSRIGSREALQREVLEEFNRRFLEDVVQPALQQPRGLPRLDVMVQRLFRRASDAVTYKACLYCSGAFEFDDVEGALRELLLENVLRWRQMLRRTVQQSIDAGHLHPDSDADQLVYELDGLFVSLSREARFMRDPRALERSLKTYQRLIHSRP
jgi:AcrR family transcriptional regulator